ncbi:MAG: DegV family protein [Dehalococcoidia bacterium]|nr:DegV family protein [Dehalococcoidia bacterium]
MDPFAIVCDSSHDLPPDISEKLRLTVVPYTINFGTESSLDDGVLPLEEFAQLLDRYDKGKGYPTTAAPAPSRFAEAFMSHIKQGLSRILTVTISHKVSNTYDAAVQAAEMVEKEYPDSEIEVVDSLSGSMVEGMLVLEAARARDLGHPLHEAKRLLENMRGNLRLMVALETTKYLAKSGRARHFQYLLSNALQIRPIITARDGALALCARVRGRMERAVDRMVDEVQQTYRSGVVSVVEGMAPDLKEMVVHKLSQRLGLNREQILETKMTPALLVHVGKRVVGVVWEQEPEPEPDPQPS